MKYITRIIDKKIDIRSKAFGAINIIGPKGSGKTRTAKERCKTIIEFQDEEKRDGYMAIVSTSPKLFLKNPNPIEEMEKDTVVTLDIDLEKLYYNMVAAKAEWLYELPQWDHILTQERRKELYKEQKSSMTVVKPPKIGRNEPCPCGSGKKYKHCCGR